MAQNTPSLTQEMLAPKVDKSLSKMALCKHKLKQGLRKAVAMNSLQIILIAQNESAFMCSEEGNPGLGLALDCL
jgi:hypothetical protein